MGRAQTQTRRRASGGFRTKTDGFNRRKMVWICKHQACHTRHSKKPSGPCVQCETKAGFWYFASTAEANRWMDLLVLQSNNLISNLTYQPAFPISINGETVTTYYADSSYIEKDIKIIEDVKGKNNETDVFLLKKKLVEASYRIQITIYRGK